ncbi:hypothetical protein DOTSEDRAFT_26632 [Dothistroma septosporum NZE10]|uniref:Uncharacterized protein n=1 Tax=Dothistroma septosporum (strain NZE10 / CBS 128990) TaxID=675120 RepID=N1PFS0_DOTSN|nr:hypothetical protein DOTSEDRAFT_26632 [Dothistroma septosporum NZE10]
MGYFQDMAESMKDAWKGQGGGLQGASSIVGDLAAEQTKSSGQKKSDAASQSLTEMAGGNKKTGNTVGGTHIDAGQQDANQQTGTADHLGVSMRK